MSKELTNDELKTLIPHGSQVYYCNTSRGICVVQTQAAEVLAILSDDDVAAVARRARLIACLPLLLDACDDDTLSSIATIVAEEPAEGDPRLAWPPPDWSSPG